MFSLFKKEAKAQCDYSYEYSYITYGDSTQPRINNDSNTIDSFCYFTHNESKYFIVADHSGRLILFDYFTGVELKCLMIKSKAEGMLRAKKFIIFLRELIEEKQQLKQIKEKERKTKKIEIKIEDYVNQQDDENEVKRNSENDGNNNLNNLNNVNGEMKDNSKDEDNENDTMKRKSENIDTTTELVDDEEKELIMEIEEFKQIYDELQNMMKLLNNSKQSAELESNTKIIQEKIIQFAQQHIKIIEEKYHIDCEKTMISNGTIGDIKFTNGIIIIAFKKEIVKISLETLLEMKENEMIISEGLKVVHEGIVKKIYIHNDDFLTIGNDKIIAFWNIKEDDVLYTMKRESDDYYKTSLLLEDGHLYIARTNEVYIYQIHFDNPSESKYLKKLQKDNHSPHIDDVDLIELLDYSKEIKDSKETKSKDNKDNKNVKRMKLLTASCDGIIAIWDLNTFTLLQEVSLQVQLSDSKKPLFNISSLLTYPRDNFTTYYFAYGGWIVQMEEKNNSFYDISPKRHDENFSYPYGRYTVDVTQLLSIGNSSVIAITGESATVYILENVKEKKHDSLKFIESRKLNGKITNVYLLDEEEQSFLIALNDGTILMLKDAMREMKRRRTLFMNEMQGF